MSKYHKKGSRDGSANPIYAIIFLIAIAVFSFVTISEEVGPKRAILILSIWVLILSLMMFPVAMYDKVQARREAEQKEKERILRAEEERIRRAHMNAQGTKLSTSGYAPRFIDNDGMGGDWWREQP